MVARGTLGRAELGSDWKFGSGIWVGNEEDQAVTLSQRSPWLRITHEGQRAGYDFRGA